MVIMLHKWLRVHELNCIQLSMCIQLIINVYTIIIEYIILNLLEGPLTISSTFQAQ